MLVLLNLVSNTVIFIIIVKLHFTNDQEKVLEERQVMLERVRME